MQYPVIVRNKYVPGYCNALTQFTARLTTTPTAARQNNYANLICGLVADGVWAKLDALWVFAAADATTALTNLVSSSFTATVAGAGTPLTFTPDSGYNNGGTSSNASYINTGLNPSTAGGNFTQNAAHCSAWEAASSTASSSLYLLQCFDGVNQAGAILPRFDPSGGVVLRCNHGGVDTAFANTDHQGHYIINRSSSTARQGYKNGASLGAYASDTSAALSNTNFTLLWDNNGATHYNNIDTVSCASVGGNLSSTDATNLYNRLRTYMTAVGVP